MKEIYKQIGGKKNSDAGEERERRCARSGMQSCDETRDSSKLLMNSRHTEPAQLPFPSYKLTMVWLVSQFLGLAYQGNINVFRNSLKSIIIVA
jgi:hypothetical protein